MAYKVEVLSADGSRWLNDGRPIVARFKGEVPAWLLILHIVFMFAAMLLAFRAGLEALRPGGSWQRFIPWTLAVTALGGLILGPLVQKYAFGAYWTGFPARRRPDRHQNTFRLPVLAGRFFPAPAQPLVDRGRYAADGRRLPDPPFGFRIRTGL